MSDALVIKNAFLLMGGHNLSCSANSLAAEHGSAELDATVLCEDTRNFVAGLNTVALGATGYVDPAVNDAILFAQVGGPTTHYSFAASPLPGSSAYNFEASNGSYSQGMTHGELHTYDISAFARGALTRGIILDHTPVATGIGGGTPRQWLPLAATETLVATLHVLTATGGTPNFQCTLQTAALVGFGSPTTVLTFDPMTGVGSQRKTFTGLITNTFYRVNRTTISGTFSFYVIISKA